MSIGFVSVGHQVVYKDLLLSLEGRECQDCQWDWWGDGSYAGVRVAFLGNPSCSFQR